MSFAHKPTPDAADIIKTLDTGRELPFVSVVTPTYNRAAFLPYLLYMFRYQDYPAERRELVILDDSPQSHQAIIDTLTQGNPGKYNIRYFHSPQRMALGKKRNQLNQLAVGEYIVCMDDDDYYPADKISYTITMMQRHRALISGSDQIAIWYSHINRILKTRSFGKKNILNGTFAYHRNYLKKHRYDDECNLGEEQGFTDNFSVTPLQLPTERTILCISHSHNTFDKDFVLGSSELVDTSLDQWVSDPLIHTWYQSLHNGTHRQPVVWESIDQVIILNLDKRKDRLALINQELATLGVPPDKISRIAAIEDEQGQRGRQQSHLLALSLAKKRGWRNYLLLEDDAIILKQEKHIKALNTLFQMLHSFPWQVILLGAEVHTGNILKSFAGMIHASDCQRVCAYLVNHHYYDTLSQQMLAASTERLEEQWRPLLQSGKWLSFYPSIGYQRAGYSDIENSHVDYIQCYFNRVNRSPKMAQDPVSQMPGNPLMDKVGFFMSSAFHYYLYRPVISELIKGGISCDVMVNDVQHPGIIQEMIDCLGRNEIPGLGVSRLSDIHKYKRRYRCLVTTGYSEAIKGVGYINIRMMESPLDNELNQASWNNAWQHILCFGEASSPARENGARQHVVGNARFDDWHNNRYAHPLPDDLKINKNKPTLFYAPAPGPSGSLSQWAVALARLTREYNVITQLSHQTRHGAKERESLALFKRTLRRHVSDDGLTLSLLAQADYVLTDNRSIAFDAVHAGKRTILLGGAKVNPPDPVLGQLLPTANDIEQLRRFLAADYDWPALEAPLAEIRRRYCDVWQDGQAGQRAARVIIDALND